jgi:two-component system, OmpR family, phosphate regulon sensor histidine kinase PhoR
MAPADLSRTTQLIVAYHGEVPASFRAESPDDYAGRATRLVSTGPPPLTGAGCCRDDSGPAV